MNREGVAFPLDTGTGKVSTTAVSKRIWAKAVGSASSGLADKISKERDWRHNYPKHIMELVEIMVIDAQTTLDVAARGLAALEAEFVFARNGKEVPIASALANPAWSYQTITIEGEAPAGAPFRVPKDPAVSEKTTSHGPTMNAEETVELLRRIASYGSCEQSVVDAIAYLGAVAPTALAGLASSHVFVLLGATSELGPYNTLMDLGMTVAAVARPGAKLEALIASAKGKAGTLVLPSQPGSGLPGSQAPPLGADLIKNLPEATAWITSLYPDRVAVIVPLIYLDSEANVRACVAMDSVCREVIASRGCDKTALAFLMSPATAHTIPIDAHAASIDAYEQRPYWHYPFGWRANARPKVHCSPAQAANDNSKPSFIAAEKWSGSKDGYHFRRNEKGLGYYLDGHLPKQVCVTNGLVEFQGPNYALSKSLQQWRCIDARSKGVMVSANMAPACKTVSVMHSAAAAAAIRGMSFFKPLLAFHPPQASAVMAGLMLQDLINPDSAANPAVPLEYPFQLFEENAFHGGGWRCAYSMSGRAGTSGYMLGKLGYNYTIE